MQTGDGGLPWVSWHWFTPLGNAVLVVPLILCAAGLLAWHHREARWPALRWLVAVGAACGLVAATKIAFYGWGTGVRAWDLTCFSGHTVLALSCWPVLGALVAPRRWSHARAVMTVLGVILALLIGWSRIRTGAHPLSEVIAGALLGGGVAAVSLRALQGRTLELGRRAVLVPVLVAALSVAMAPTARLPSERWMARVGVALSGAEHPVNRHQWRKQPPRGESPLSQQAMAPALLRRG